MLDALQANGLADNTLVIFTSDNGGAGYLGLPDVNKPYRGWKLTLFEGGTHVPFFARWPGHIAPGTRYDMPVQHIDILPTAAAAAGAKLPTTTRIRSTAWTCCRSCAANAPVRRTKRCSGARAITRPCCTTDGS